MRGVLSVMLGATIAVGALTTGCTHSDNLAPPPADAHVNVDAPLNAGAGLGGGQLPTLAFAIVGDTRPMNIDDTAHYPTDIITQIWTDVAAEATPPAAFAVTTGDYMYAATNFTEQDPQLDLYLGARTAYPGLVYPAMGNHECNGYTNSNCGEHNDDGEPANYTEFMARMIAPLGITDPFYIERFAATDGSWTAKLIVIAANSWTAAQEGWLAGVLTEPTTYTFVVRHEGVTSDTAPGVTPSQTLINLNPLTLLIVGHTHTYRHDIEYKQLVVGNGGAPLTGGADYGYVMVVRNPDGSLTLTSYDYMTHAVVETFSLNADGSMH